MCAKRTEVSGTWARMPWLSSCTTFGARGTYCS